jgi:hypothetical protein
MQENNINESEWEHRQRFQLSAAAESLLALEAEMRAEPDKVTRMALLRRYRDTKANVGLLAG